MNSTSFKFIIFITLGLTLWACQNEPDSKCDYIKSYYPAVYQADYAFETQNYKKAYHLYKTAFEHCQARVTPDYNELQNFTESAAAVGEFDTALIYAKKLIVIGKDLDFFENRSVFQDFLASKQGQSLYDDYDKLKKRFQQTIDLKLRHQIADIVREDKHYYTDRHYSSQDRDSIDQVHKKELKAIFNKNGYPNAHLIGVYSIDHRHTDLSNVMLHIRDSSRINYFIPKLRKLVAQGEAPPRVLGNLVDQYRLYQGQDQRYATFMKTDGSPLKMPHDRHQIDKDRQSIGLPTLKMERKKDSLMSF